MVESLEVTPEVCCGASRDLIFLPLAALAAGEEAISTAAKETMNRIRILGRHISENREMTSGPPAGSPKPGTTRLGRGAHAKFSGLRPADEYG